jgi:hypothetical protein
MSDAGFSTYFGSGSSVGYIGVFAYSGGGLDGGVDYTLTPVTGRTGGLLDGGQQDWAINFSLMDEAKYGGALGIWMSCVNASSYNGVSFWVRGQTPVGTCSSANGGGSCLSVTLSTQSTSLPTDGGTGDCMGTSSTCVSPHAADVPISTTWSKVTIPWANFVGGMTGGTAYTPNGSGITGITFNVSLVWTASDAGGDGATTYVPVPANIDLQVDDIGFY